MKVTKRENMIHIILKNKVLRAEWHRRITF